MFITFMFLSLFENINLLRSPYYPNEAMYIVVMTAGVLKHGASWHLSDKTLRVSPAKRRFAHPGETIIGAALLSQHWKGTVKWISPAENWSFKHLFSYAVK